MRAPASKVGLEREQILLDAARKSLAQGDAPRALEQLDEHEKSFPHGRLVEEREAMRVNGLVETGRYEDARKSAESFRQSYPHSFLRPSVEAAIEAIP